MLRLDEKACPHGTLEWRLSMKKKMMAMILAALMVVLTAFATGTEVQAAWQNYAKTIKLNRAYSIKGTQNDPYFLLDGCYADVLRFTVPAKGTVSFLLKSRSADVPNFRLYKTSQPDDYYWFGWSGNRSKISDRNGVFTSKWNVRLPKGSYYLQILYGSQTMNTKYKFAAKYQPTFAKTKITGIAGVANGFKVRYKKASAATGYQIQYSTNKNMANARKVTVKGVSSTLKAIRGLSGKRTYYVRVRSYKKVKISGKTKAYFKSWSAKKSVRTK